MKRVISFLLSIVMVISMLPVSAFATDVQTEDPTTSLEATEPSAEATEPSTEATEPSTEGTEPSTEATEPSSEATEPSTEATEPTTEATEPSSEATEPSTEATEPSTEATEPSAEATEPEVKSEQKTVAETYVSDVSLPDSDALMAGYLEKVFYSSDVSFFGTAAGDTLTGPARSLYGWLKTQIEAVAAGEESATTFVLDQSRLLDWDVQVTFDYADMNAAAMSLFDTFEVGKVLDALLHDCPYELYWFDKTTGIAESVSGFETPELGTCEIQELYFVFAVVQDMMADGSSADAPYVDITLGTSAEAALSRAQSVVDKYAGKSAYDRLTGYKNEICALVAYNDDAADNGDFSADADPWQLLYVFDGNNKTDVVCEGYSKAFQYLCDLDGGIDCYTVWGVMTGGTGAGAHMWNIVTLDGKNYIVDVTNSDSGTAGSDGSLFLNGTSGSVSEGYTFDTAGGDISFTYDANAVSLWSSSGILALADAAYVPENDVPENKCGEDLTWSFNQDTKTLTIQGTGPMYSYTDDYAVNANPAPWNELEIHKIIINEGVTTLGNHAFSNYCCFNVGSLDLPDSIAVIGDEALPSSLTSLHLPENVASIGLHTMASVISSITVSEDNPYFTGSDGILYNKDMTQLVWMPTHWNEDSRYTFQIPDSVTDIAYYGMYGVINTDAVTLPENLQSIGDYGFWATYMGSEVDIPDSVSYIGNYAFYGCEIDELDLPANLPMISEYAFGRNNITELVIPKSVAAIAYGAFDQCSDLKKIEFQGSAPAFNDNAFLGVNATVTYPADDDSWTEDVMQNYGGNLTWKAETGSMTQEELRAAIDQAVANSEPMMFLSESVDLNSSFTIPAGFTLLLQDGAVVTVKSGELNVQGSIIVQSGTSLIVESGASYKTASPLSITAEINRATVEGVANKDMFAVFIASNAEELASVLNEAAKGGYAGTEVRPNAYFPVEKDVTVPAGVSLFIRGVTLTISDGYTLTNNGRISLVGSGGLIIEEYATLVNNGSLEVDNMDNFELRGNLIGSHPNTISQEKFLEELNAAGGTYELTKTVFIDELDLNGKSITIAEGATMVVRGNVNLNWTTLTVNGTLDLYGSMFVNNDSYLYANGTVRNYGALHIGFYKESNIEGYAGVMEINGSMNVEGGYVTLRSMQENAGGSMTVNGTLNVCPNNEGWGGFIENAGKIVVNSTGTLSVSIDGLNNGGIWVGPSAELTIQDGAVKDVQDLSISVIAGENALVNGLSNSALFGIYQPTSPEALEAAVNADEGYGAVNVELNEIIGMTRDLTIPEGVTLTVNDGASLSVHNTDWTIKGKLINYGSVQITGGGSLTIEGYGSENKGYFHVGMQNVESGTLNINGIMGNTGYMCVHPDGVMNIGAGHCFGINRNENSTGFLQCNGTVNVYGNLDNSALMVVDNTAEKPAKLNLGEGATVYLYNGSDTTIGENGVLTADGYIGTEGNGYFAIAGNATLNDEYDGNLNLIRIGDVVNNGTINGNVLISGNAEFSNNGTVNGEIVYPKGTDRLQALIDEGEIDSNGDVNVYLHEHITLDEDFTVDNGVWIFVEQDASICVPAGKELTIAGDGHIVNWGYIQVDGTLTTSNSYALQNIGGELLVSGNAILHTKPGNITYSLTAGGSVTGVSPDLLRGHADVSDIETLDEVCKDTTPYYSLEIIVNETITLDRDITVPENAFLQLNYFESMDGPHAGGLVVPDGFTLTNNGEILVAVNCELTVEEGGKLVNNGSISGSGSYINNGSEEDNGNISIARPVTDKESFIEVLEEAGRKATMDNWGYIRVDETVDIVLEAGDEITIPRYVSVDFFGNLTVGSGATFTIEENTNVTVYSDFVVQTGAQLIHKGYLVLRDGTTNVANGTYAYYSNSTIVVWPDATVYGLPLNRMIYQAEFGGTEELTALLEYVKTAPYSQYEFQTKWGMGDEISISGSLTIPENVTIAVCYGHTLYLEAGTDMVNNGTIEIYDTACLGILENASLNNQGQIRVYGSGHLFIAEGGHFEGNSHVSGNVPGAQAGTWEELEAALTEAGASGDYQTVSLVNDVVVPAGKTLVVPKMVQLCLYANLTVPATSKVVISADSMIGVLSDRATLYIEKDATLTNNCELAVECGALINEGTYSGNGFLYQTGDAIITGISKSLIELDYYFDTFEELKHLLETQSNNGYMSTYLVANGDLVIEESITIPADLNFVAGMNGGTVTIPQAVTVNADGGIWATHNGMLEIQQNGRLNINNWATIAGMAQLNNYGVLNLPKNARIDIYGVLNNFGIMNLLGTQKIHEPGMINDQSQQVNETLVKMEKALLTGETYNLTEPLYIDSNVILQYDGHRMINVTGDGAIIVTDGGYLALGSSLEVCVSDGGRIEVQDNAGLGILGNAYVEIQDGSLIAEAENAFLGVETWGHAMLMICEDVAEYSFNENIGKDQMTGLYLIHSEQELLEALNEKMPNDGYGDHTLVFNNSFSIRSGWDFSNEGNPAPIVVIPENVSVLIRDNNVVTIEQGGYVEFNGLMNIIHGGQLNVNGVLDICVRDEGIHFPSGYINVASNGMITVAKNAEMNLYWATLNLGNSGTLTNYGIIRNSGRIIRNDGSSVLGNPIVEDPRYEGWGVATNLADLKGLLDQGFVQIEIRGEVVLDRDFAFGDMEFMVTDGGRLVIPEGVELTLDGCTVELWYDAEVVVAGTLNLNGRTNMGGTLTIEETGVVNNNGIFSMYGTINNFGRFISDRNLMWDVFENEDGELVENWTWNGNDPVIPEDSTMTQAAFEELLAEAAEGGEWNWVELYKGVTLEEDLVIDQPINLTFPGYILVPEGVTLTINTVMDFTGGLLEVQNGGTLINNSALNVYDGDLVIKDGATLITHEINGETEAGQHIELHGGWLTFEDGADIQITHNVTPNGSVSGYDGIIIYWPINQGEYNMNGVDPKYVQVHKGINWLGDLEDLIWYSEQGLVNPYFGLDGHTWGPIYVDHNLTLPENLNLNLNELWDDIPALTIGEGNTLTNKGDIVVHEFGKILIEENATLDNAGDIFVYGGQVINEGGTFIEGRIDYFATTGRPAATTAAELESKLRDFGEAEVVGEVVLDRYINIEPGQRLQVGIGATLVVPEGITLCNNGITVIRGGKMIVQGVLENSEQVYVDYRGELNIEESGTYECYGGRLFRVGGGSINGIGNDQIVDMRDAYSEEELREMTNNYDGYEGVEIYTYGDITLNENYYISSDVFVNVGDGTLRVASGNTLTVCGRLHVHEGNRLLLEAGAKLEVLGELVIFGDFINEGENNIIQGENAYMSREVHVYDEQGLVRALERADDLDRIFVQGMVTVPEDLGTLEIREGLHMIVHGSLNIPETVELKVNGELFVDRGTVNMNGGSLVNNGFITALWGGIMNIPETVEVSGNGRWIAKEMGEIISYWRLDHLVDFMAGAENVDDLNALLTLVGEHEFKSEHIYVDCDIHAYQNLTIPEGTVLSIENGSFEMSGGTTLTNNGTIQIRNWAQLWISEHETFNNNGRVEIYYGEGRVIHLGNGISGTVVEMHEDEDGEFYEEALWETWAHSEVELRASLNIGYQIVWLNAYVELTDDLTLNRMEGAHPQAQKLILSDGGTLIVPEGKTLTLNSRLNIQTGGALIVHGNLVNNVYDAVDDPNDDIGIWNEDGALIIDGGTYSAPNGGYIIMTANYGAYVEGIDNSLIERNTYVYTADELYAALEVAPQYGYNQIIAEEDLVLTKSISIPANTYMSTWCKSLVIPGGMTVINKGILEVEGYAIEGSIEDYPEAKIVVAKDASLYNYGTAIVGYGGMHATLVIDAGGKFYNYGTISEECSYEHEDGYKHVINNTVLVKDITVSVNGSTENVTVGLKAPVQLSAAVQPANATQKEVEWTIVETGEILKNGILTITELPEGKNEMTITVRATATDGSGISDDLIITIREYKVSAEITGSTTLKFNEKTTMTASCQNAGKKAVWSLKPGDELFASLSVNKTTNVATLTAKTLTEKKTVTVIASAEDGTETPAELEITILPKVQMVSVNVNGTDYTGQTMTYDLGATDQRILLVKPVIAPVGAFGDIQWKVDNTKLARFLTNEDGSYQMTDAGEYKLQLLDEKTGTVKITATAQDGSKLTGVASIKIVDLIQEIAIVDKTDELVGGKTFTFTAFEAEDGTAIDGSKKLDKSKVQWSLADKDAPFASIDANGKLTTQKVLEKVTVTVTAEIIGNEIAESVSCPVTIYPLTTQVEIMVGETMVNDLTVKFDPAKGEIYIPGQDTAVKTSAGSMILDEVLFPSDLMIDGEPWMNVKWTSSNAKVAKIDAEGGMLEVLKDKNGNYLTGIVTITAAAQDGSGKKATMKVQIGTFAEAVTITNPDADGILRVGESTTLTAVTTPEKPTTAGVTWSLRNADDSAYVTLAANGKVTAKTVYEKHTVTIVATSKDGMAEAEIAISVMPKAEYVLNLTMDEYSGLGEKTDAVVTGHTLLVDMLSGSTTVNLFAKMFNVTDDEISDWDVTWTSSNTGIAMFEVWNSDADGFVTEKTVTGSDATIKMLKSGSATITIKATDPADAKKSLTAKVIIKATNLVEALEIESKTETFTVASGKALTLTATAFPTEASTKTVTWSLAPGGEEFATINTSGKLTAKANLTQAATVTVIATAKDGSGVTAEQEIVILPLVQGLDIWMKDLGVVTNTTLVWDMVENPYLSVNADTYPEIASQDVTWSSSSKAIAEIDPDTGVIICKKAGTVTITATAKDGSGKKATFKLTVVKQMTSLTLADQIIAGGKALDLSKLVEILEADTTNKKLTWTMTGDGSEQDGTAFATLSAAGKLTTKTVTGTKKVTITVASTDGSELVAQCEVIIMPAVTKVSIYDGEDDVTGKTLTLGVGEQMILYAVNDPVDSLQDWVWSSNNAAVTVDENGMITAITAGKTVTITAKANDGSGKSATVKIKTIQKMEELILPATDIVASTKSITLKPEILPANTTTKTLTWSIVTGSDYATIDKNGKLTAKKLDGDDAVTVTVMAASTDGSELAAITRVTITPLTTKVRILNAEGNEMVKTEKLYLDEGMMYLTGISDPASAAQTYNWTVSNGSYAGFVVEDEEAVKANASGQAVALVGLVPGKTVTVTATADDGSGKKASFKVTTVQRMQELTLDETAILGEGKSMTLRANVWPANTTNKNLTWELIDGHDYVTLSAKGVLKAKTGLGEGIHTAVVQVSSNDGSDLTATCSIDVYPLTKSVAIQDDRATIDLYVNSDAYGTVTLRAEADNGTAFAANDFTWSTSSGGYAGFVNAFDETVSTISGEEVLIKALKPGKTVTITATAKDGSGKKDTIKIRTIQAVEDIILPEDQVITPGRSITLKPQIAPANATNKKLHWSILSGDAYATISQSGVLTAKKGIDGTHTITVQAETVGNGDAGNFAVTCDVTLCQRATKVSVWNGSEPVTGKTLNLFVDQPMWITASSDPADTHTQYSWKVSNAKHAAFTYDVEDEETGEMETVYKGQTVGEGVQLEALEPGKTVTVTATAMDGSGKKATFKVKTMQHVTDIFVENRFMASGRSLVLDSVVSPSDATNTKVEYEILRAFDVYGGYDVDPSDVVVKLGNLLFAKRTEGYYEVEIEAIAQDGSGVTSNFWVIICPEVAKGVNIFDAYSGTVVKEVQMTVGERIDLYGEPDNYDMAARSFDWVTSDMETAILISSYDSWDDEGNPVFEEVYSRGVKNREDVGVEALKPGIAVVTLKTVDGSNKTATVVIHVSEAAE